MLPAGAERDLAAAGVGPGERVGDGRFDPLRIVGVAGGEAHGRVGFVDPHRRRRRVGEGEAAVARVADRVAGPEGDLVGALAGDRRARGRRPALSSGGPPSTPIAVTGPPGPAAAIPESGSVASAVSRHRPGRPAGGGAFEAHLRRRAVDADRRGGGRAEAIPDPETATAWT